MKLLLLKNKKKKSLKQKLCNKLKENLENRILNLPQHLTFIPTQCFLTLEDGTGNFSRKFGTELPLYAAWCFCFSIVILLLPHPRSKP